MTEFSANENNDTYDYYYNYHSVTYSKPYPTSAAEAALLRAAVRQDFEEKTKHLEPLSSKKASILTRTAAPHSRRPVSPPSWRTRSTSGAGSLASASAGAGDFEGVGGHWAVPPAGTSGPK
jgi:hypothetical protein